ncbi:hypothetical protein EIP91_011259 [Steccherinum ochraceum]|uniref:LYR motif-containing protein Cup1-like N-terminal domain-containing protein n=1 Tax=Steccherinum ochraceum TaxID=92696 RepID=A0A4R0RBL9_9APHY|nr:hypothetical protein EIP91_011259 [Steccherinum ochraceum]
MQMVNKIQAANNGKSQALDSILDLAYGRKGKLRWELLQPMIPSRSSQPIPERIIPAVEKSRPPVYSPELTALLTSTHSRMIKPLTAKQLHTPPLFPKRGDPNSQEARDLGPLSKRREVNLRWRHFAASHKKVLPPLQIVYGDLSKAGDAQYTTNPAVLHAAGIRTSGTQNLGIFEDIEALAQRSRPTPLTRREKRLYTHTFRQVSDDSSKTGSHPPRKLLRRAYRRLLGRLPTMSYTVKTGLPGRFTVKLSPYALSRLNPKDILEADAGDLAWVAGSSDAK